MHLPLWIYHFLFIGLLCIPPSLVLAADFTGPGVSVLDATASKCKANTLNVSVSAASTALGR